MDISICYEHPSEVIDEVFGIYAGDAVGYTLYVGNWYTINTTNVLFYPRLWNQSYDKAYAMYVVHYYKQLFRFCVYRFKSVLNLMLNSIKSN